VVEDAGARCADETGRCCRGRPPLARTHLADGLWLTLRAAALGAAEQPRTPGNRGATLVVTIEQTSSPDRLDLFARAFGCTARERELLGLLAAGGDTREIAHRMSQSDHTVQDHLKSIFAKTGARDRVSVLSRALGSTTSTARARPQPPTAKATTPGPTTNAMDRSLESSPGGGVGSGQRCS
jgi:DNA-binding CsgD family transcriptional regulator